MLTTIPDALANYNIVPNDINCFRRCGKVACTKVFCRCTNFGAHTRWKNKDFALDAPSGVRKHTTVMMMMMMMMIVPRMQYSNCCIAQNIYQQMAFRTGE
eukprot:scaffold12318_cov151-Amphora_coffeaeformis.AAC.1